MKIIMVRRASDDFEAMKIAQGMETAGGNVFSIANNGESLNQGGIQASTSYTVWCKARSVDHINEIDVAIEIEMGD